ncbi:hypothetical protein PTSG_01862 [Salpingoeca rosetta]|uniref:DUF7164 domain-containing protein n=1 Tax=Salpingoeca rosetta (strain ATCC 50818 / BSB-021) TaxID=946362 RepID=F2TZ63_SALR5|nr:uncharacterized protein PTSG_01862 [Salpingoeca rosetta]EGD78887.1 hypothetical protein PTSG_01862 [Salpingoeca rosetta]|eukprot:XP_004997843.1 hypothetical protein PTSG_01862 [Salpingoeca rosetta]
MFHGPRRLLPIGAAIVTCMLVVLTVHSGAPTPRHNANLGLSAQPLPTARGQTQKPGDGTVAVGRMHAKDSRVNDLAPPRRRAALFARPQDQSIAAGNTNSNDGGHSNTSNTNTNTNTSNDSGVVFPQHPAIARESKAVHNLLYSGGVASFPPFRSLAEPPLFISLVPDNTALTHLCLSHLSAPDMQECNSADPARHQVFALSSEGHVGFEVQGVGHYCLHASDERIFANSFASLADTDEDDDHIDPSVPRKVVYRLCTSIFANAKVMKEGSLSTKDAVDTWQFVPGKGLVHRETGNCLTYNYHTKITLEPCRDMDSQWMLRTDVNGSLILPRQWDKELIALAERRERQIKPLLATVRTLASKTRKLTHRAHSRASKRTQGVDGRRAVVFFMEPSRMLTLQVKWWLRAWRMLKLDEPDQRMDVLIMGNGDDFESLMSLGCEMKSLDTQTSIPHADGHGVCWLFPFRGINSREPGKYDAWFNSLEVLVNKKTRPLLEQYDQLLRADADTLPTPKMRGYWSEKLVLSLNAGYATRYADAKLATLAADAGLVWHDLRNIGSTFYGPAKSVLHLVELTVAVGALLRTYTFAPGTGCKLPPKLRPADVDCEWGSGLWLGVSLLYSQQIAANHMIGSGFPVKFEAEKKFDVGTEGEIDVCSVLMLHVYHNRERFSKLALLDGEYKNFDMSSLDFHVARDLITYFALTANDQGMNGEVALSRSGDPSKLCG